MLSGSSLGALRELVAVAGMTAEEIWKSQSEFQKYQLNNFKKYNNNMKKLVSNKVICVAIEEAIY